MRQYTFLQSACLAIIFPTASKVAILGEEVEAGGALLGFLAGYHWKIAGEGSIATHLRAAWAALKLQTCTRG